MYSTQNYVQRQIKNRREYTLKNLPPANTVRLRDEGSALDYPTNIPVVSHQGVPVSIFFTQGTVLLILTFKSLSLTSVCSIPDLYFTARIGDGNQFTTHCKYPVHSINTVRSDRRYSIHTNS